MNTLLLILTLGTTPSADSLRLETVDGKTFIIHRVEKRETLFSIAKRYGVAMSLVVDANKGSDSGIEAGEELKIPYAGNNRTRTTDGTVHTVGEKQTLYSISKQYGVTVDDIRKWNNVTEKDIRPGVKLVIRDKSKESSSPAQAASSNTPASNTQAATATSNPSYHTVAEKETLFAISRKYGIPVNDLIRWNNLSSSDLKAGQRLVLSDQQGSQAATATESPSKSSGSSQDPNTVKIQPVKSDELKESGFASIMPGTEDNRKYLGYHRSIKTGTVVRVRNTQSQKEIFVRIIGNLPESDPPDMLIRMSKVAGDKIGLQERVPVEIIYFQ